MEPAVAGFDAAFMGVCLANLELKPPALEVQVGALECVFNFCGLSGYWCLFCFHNVVFFETGLMAIPQQHGTEGAGHEGDNDGLDEGGRVLWFERVHGVITDFVLKLWVCQQGRFKKFPVRPAYGVGASHG